MFPVKTKGNREGCCEENYSNKLNEWVRILTPNNLKQSFNVFERKSSLGAPNASSETVYQSGGLLFPA